MSRQARAARLLRRSGLDRLGRRLGPWRGLLVLNYHRIGDPAASPLDRDLFSATAEAFAEQVAFVARHCEPIGLADVPSALAARRGRRVLITFDDGYRDNHDVAFPILHAHGVPAVFFLATGFLDRPRLSWWDELAWMGAGPEATARYKQLGPDEAGALLEAEAARTGRGRAGTGEAEGVWMTWDHARAMRDAGMDFGGHTVDHPVLARLAPAAQREQIEGCATRLRDELGIGLEAFSYPVGARDSYDATTMEILRAAGCGLSFTFHGGHARPGATDLLAIPRMSIGTWLSTDEIRAATLLPQLFARW